MMFYLFCTYRDWQGQKCNLKCPKVTSMRLKLNYSVCTVISACTHPCDTNTFTHSLARIHLWQLTIHNICMEFFLKSKNFSFIGIREISTLMSYIIKLPADISDSSFFLDSLSKSKIFPIFLRQYFKIFFHFLRDFEM